MELLETTDPEKKRLIEATDRHKHELQRDVKAISDKTENAVKNALIIGGSLALTYLLVSQLGGRKKKKSKKKQALQGNEENDDIENLESVNSTPSMFAQLSERAISMASVMLLDIAKDKLAEYLQNRKSRHEDS
jgi:Icc-related predicted phosphoesterase